MVQSQIQDNPSLTERLGYQLFHSQVQSRCLHQYVEICKKLTGHKPSRRQNPEASCQLCGVLENRTFSYEASEMPINCRPVLPYAFLLGSSFSELLINLSCIKVWPLVRPHCIVFNCTGYRLSCSSDMCACMSCIACPPEARIELRVVEDSFCGTAKRHHSYQRLRKASPRGASVL